MNENRCVVCGKIIPEGYQVCMECLNNPVYETLPKPYVRVIRADYFQLENMYMDLEKKYKTLREQLNNKLSNQEWVPAGNPPKIIIGRHYSDFVLVTVIDEDGDKYMRVGTYSDEGWSTDNYADEEEEVVAWMPLPEPYRG